MEINQTEVQINGISYIRKDSANSNHLAEKVDGLEYAIVRSKNHGVLAGYIKKIEGQRVDLVNCRRIWYFKGCETLEEMSVYGSKTIDLCKITPTVEKETMLEACGIIYCTEFAKNQIKNAKEWKS